MRLPDGMRVLTEERHSGRVELALEVEEVVHLCPPRDAGLFPCCGRTPFEVPRWHRMTLDPERVTCPGGKQG